MCILEKFAHYVHETPFLNQNPEDNISLFESLIDQVQNKEELLPMVTLIHSTPFMGNETCLDLCMKKITLYDQELVHTFNKRYFFGGIYPILNFHALQCLIQEKQKKRGLPISIRDSETLKNSDLLKETLEPILQGDEDKRAFIIIDYHFYPCHYFTLAVERRDGKLFVLLCESTDLEKTPTPAILEKNLKKLSKELRIPISFYKYPFARQRDRVSCPQFALNDAVQACQDPNLFGNFPSSASRSRYREIIVNTLPPKMMKYTQFSVNPAYHTYESLLLSDPKGANMIGRYLTSGEDNLHSSIKRTKAISGFLLNALEG